MRRFFVILCSLIFILTISVSAVTYEKTTPGIVSYDPETGITIYRDAAGGYVFSNLPVPKVASEAQQRKSLSLSTWFNKKYELPIRNDDYIDYEYNPIYIGTWGGVDAYARHTLGDYDTVSQHLTSYGYVSYYSAGLNALPYRNGSANNNSSQGVVDVAKYDYFNIRDLETDTVKELRITDWGPNQYYHPDRIADIDSTEFLYLHGNTTDGLFYGRTWVSITNYNP